MKKTGIVVLAVLVFVLSGCGGYSTVRIVTEEKIYPEPDDVVGSLEEAGYTIERGGKFDELEVDVDRIKAVNGEEYIDICYNVASVSDMDMIIEYYMNHYKKYNLVSDTDIVFCYSSDSVIESAGLQ